MASEVSPELPKKDPRPSEGRTLTNPIASLMPQRPTIWRAIVVTWSMSDSAPVLIVPNTAARSCGAGATRVLVGGRLQARPRTSRLACG